MAKTILRKPSSSPAPEPATTQQVMVGGVSVDNPFLTWKGARTTAFKPPAPGRLRTLLSGQVGGGKTTWAAGIPNALILDFENKTGGVRHLGANSVILPIQSVEELESAVDKLVLLSRSGKRPFDTVVFDSIDSFCDMTMAFYTETFKDQLRPGHNYGTYGSHGAGWSHMANFEIDKVSRLYRAGYGWTALTHWSWETETVGEVTIRTRKLAGHNLFLKYLSKEAEFIGRLDRTSLLKHREITKTIGGKSVTSKESYREEAYVLDFSLDGVNEDKGSGARKYIDIPDELIVPEVGGYDVFLGAYAEAVKRIQNQEQ